MNARAPKVPSNSRITSPHVPQVQFTMTVQDGLQAMKLQDLKSKSPTDLLAFAEELEIENASSMRKQDMLFAILKELAERNVEITGTGVVETLQDGFGFLRSPESNYLAGPDDIYVSPSQIRRFGLRTGDTVEGPIRAPKDGERYFALLKVSSINFEDPEAIKHKVHFDNLTPLYPTRWLKMELDDPTIKDKTGRVIATMSITRPVLSLMVGSSSSIFSQRVG